MSHPKQRQFCERVKAKFPEYFKAKWVIDIGSLDVNGNNRGMFTDCTYIGIDLGPGPNVDIVAPAHELTVIQFDTVVSTEALEHDPFYRQTLAHVAMRLLKPKGLFLFTCATYGRPKHGTNEYSPGDSKYTNNHYANLGGQDIRDAIDIELFFDQWAFETDEAHHDLYFWGIKRGNDDI